MKTLFDQELVEAMEQLCDETSEAVQLAKVSSDLDDLAACLAVALLKLDLAIGFVEQRHPRLRQGRRGKAREGDRGVDRRAEALKL